MNVKQSNRKVCSLKLKVFCLFSYISSKHKNQFFSKPEFVINTVITTIIKYCILFHLYISNLKYSFFEIEFRKILKQNCEKYTLSF